MNKVLLVLFLVVAIAIEVSFSWPRIFKSKKGAKLNDDYKAINIYLLENVESDDWRANIGKASAWLAEIKEDKNHEHKNLIPALEQFLALDAILSLPNEQKCSWESYLVLQKNDEATNGRAHRFDWEELKLERIEKVIAKCFFEHAKVCTHVYPELFWKKLPTTKINIVTRTGSFLLDIFMDRVRGYFGHQSETKAQQMEAIYFEFVRDDPSVGGNGDGFSAIKGLKRAIKNDPASDNLDYLVEKDGSIKLDKGEFVQMFDEYAIDACKYVSENFNKIFIPATFDEVMVEPREFGEQYHTREWLNYFWVWASTRTCDLLVNQGKKTVLLDKMLLRAGYKTASKNKQIVFQTNDL